MSDPFTLVHNAIWTMLEANSGFTDLVPAGNRIRMSGDNRAPDKDEMSDRDYPEVRIVPIKGLSHLGRTSNGTSFEKFWEIQVATGDQRPTEVLYPLEWEIFRAHATWETYLKPLLWNAREFVNLARPWDLTESLKNIERNRSQKGWVTLWIYKVEMWFPTAELPPS